MKFSKELMQDKKTQHNKIGNFVSRSIRNKWAEEQENTLRELCPYPISYDIHTFSPNISNLYFTEYEYTELLGGMWVNPQCLEITCRMIQDASLENNEHLTSDQIKNILGDKYELVPISDKWKKAKKIIFLPGHNLLPLSSHELVSQLMFNNDDIFLKPHPITFDRIVESFGREFGWDRVIERGVSGHSLLEQCEEIYTTSASEMAITGILLDKKVFNISNFLNEGYGAYYALNRLIFNSKNITEAKLKISNVFQSEWSGICFPHHTNIKQRFENFFNKSLEYREKFKPLSPPWHPKLKIQDETN